MMNKKGQFDLIEIIIAVITVSCLVLIVLIVNTKVTDLYKTVVPDPTSTAYKAIDESNTIFQGGLDKLFLGIFIILLIGMIILAFYIQASPLFIVIFLLLSVISTWFAAIISNIYMEVEATGIFAAELLHTPIMTFIMENLPILIGGFAMILLIVTYSKNILFQRVGMEGQ